MQHRLCMNTCRRNHGTALSKALGHALQVNISTRALFCCVWEVMNAKLSSFFPKLALSIKKLGCDR